MNGSLVALLLIRIALGIGFLWAGLSKISEPSNFSSLIENYEILSPAASRMTALLLPRLELLIGACLVLGLFTRAAALCASVLSFGFASAVGSALYRGLQIDCGCFGSGSAVSWTHVWLDLAILLASGWLLLRSPGPISLDRKLDSETWSARGLSLYLSLPIALLAGALLSDAVSPPVPVQTSRSGPVIEFTPTTLVLGQVKQGEVVTSEITYKNISDRTLVIDRVEASCGCTTASPAKFRLEPGESTPLSVSLATESKMGPTTNQVKIYFQGVSEGVAFSVTADVLPIISVEPMLVRPEPGKPMLVSVTSLDPKFDLEVERVVSPIPELNCRVLQKTDKGDIQIEVQTQGKLPRPEPPMDAWTIEIHTNKKGLPPLPLYVQP